MEGILRLRQRLAGMSLGPVLYHLCIHEPWLEFRAWLLVTATRAIWGVPVLVVWLASFVAYARGHGVVAVLLVATGCLGYSLGWRFDYWTNPRRYLGKPSGKAMSSSRDHKER